MKLKLSAIAASILFITACGEAPKSASTAAPAAPAAKTPLATPEQIAEESAKASQLFDTIFEEQLARSPMGLAYMGRKTDNDKWDNLTESYELETQTLYKKHLMLLKQLDLSKLDENTQVSYRLLRQQLEEEIEDFKWRLYDYPVNQMFGYHSSVPSLLINQHSVDSKHDAQAYITRLNRIPNFFDQLIHGLEQRAEAGIIAPKFVFPHVIRDSQNILKGYPFEKDAEDSTIYADFKAKVTKLFPNATAGGETGQTARSAGNIEQQQLNAFLQAAEKALLESVKPAYEKLIAHLGQLEKKADTQDGVWKFPEGEAFYNVELKRTTTTDLTAEEIHNIGLAEVERIHNEMRAIKEKVGFEGDLKAFMTFMREDDQFYYPDTEEGRAKYLAEATALIDNMKTRLDELFITKPKAELHVKAVEAFREQSAGKAFYQQPAEDGSRPGLYYANLYRMKDMPTYQMEALAYHEGLPGHHMQIAISQELENMPKFRRFGGYTAYIEGWGLYSELVPKEIGLYEDPYSDFGRLAMELWRACRLVVDTGIHAMKWTRDEGIEYYAQNTPNPRTDAVKMVERHVVMPSQATAYKVGMIKILELRESAKAKLGDKFDIRQFHDVVLKNGAVPLNVLEKNVDAWVASKA
ncbi:DUF885 domain-containing protein [Catenovulum sp. SM1970]|uniref:DUF885 domain-containing protein n=1 Tax=Marinifaba aquimaris TaxID=2741323 RepID=UPI001574D1F9|nr:DUF885 domain-containing protein [Marinifaba aquimaris]NTS76435.1 DUF885 domain-containing protein [Marinifaba aquimaris]